MDLTLILVALYAECPKAPYGVLDCFWSIYMTCILQSNIVKCITFLMTITSLTFHLWSELWSKQINHDLKVEHVILTLFKKHLECKLKTENKA